MPGQGVEYSLQHPSATQLLCMVTCSPPPAKVKESLRPFGFESVSFRGQVALPSRVKDPCGVSVWVGSLLSWSMRGFGRNLLPMSVHDRKGPDFGGGGFGFGFVQRSLSRECACF